MNNSGQNRVLKPGNLRTHQIIHIVELGFSPLESVFLPKLIYNIII